MMVVQFFVVLFFFPETKGITLEEMQHKLDLNNTSDARKKPTLGRDENFCSAIAVAGSLLLMLPGFTHKNRSRPT